MTEGWLTEADDTWLIYIYKKSSILNARRSRPILIIFVPTQTASSLLSTTCCDILEDWLGWFGIIGFSKSICQQLTVRIKSKEGLGLCCVTPLSKILHLYSIVHLPLVGFELATVVLICTDCIGNCKSNYHRITTTTASNQKGLYKNRISWEIPPYLNEWKQQQIVKCTTGIWMIILQ